jgi:hypothetical protein
MIKYQITELWHHMTKLAITGINKGDVVQINEGLHGQVTKLEGARSKLI